MGSLIKRFVFKLLSPIMVRQYGEPGVFITFDDGPHPEKTLAILDSLQQFQAKATFFMSGTEMDKYPEVVERVVREGHTVGYHSYTHTSMKKQTFATFKDEMERAKTLYQRFGIENKYYRPPYGDLNVTGFFWLLLNGWKIIMWSKDSRDSFDSLEQVKVNVSASNIEPGEILLFHDDYELTAELLPALLKEYENHQISTRLIH